MKTLNSLKLALALVGVAASSAQAAQITGSIDMSGTVTLNNMLLGSATATTGFNNVMVGGMPTGTYAVIPNMTPATWTNFGWNPSTTPVNNLWSVTSGANTYTFDLATVTVVTQTNAFLNLLGTGTLEATGFDNTPGMWSFTVSNPTGGAAPNANFTFANSNVAVPSGIPDGGSTVVLLGGTLIGIAALRRRLLS